MNGKPKNWVALCKSVQAADWTAMPSQRRKGKLVDKLILNTLVQASNEFGTGARPGNAQLMKNSGVKWAQVHEHLKLLIGAGMIECTQVGNGAWNASVYRILYNHPVFPNHSENGREWFCIGGPDDSGPNHPVTDAPNHPVSDAKSSKPSGYEGANHPVTAGQPSGYEGENRRNHPVYEPEHILPLPTTKPSPIPSQPAPSAQKPDGWQVFSENLQPCLSMSKAAMTKSQEAELRELVAKHGGPIVATAVKNWQGQRSLDGMKMSPWFFFLKEYAAFLREAIEDSPEVRKRKEERQDLFVDQQNLLVWSQLGIIWPVRCTENEKALIDRARKVGNESPIMFSRAEISTLRELVSRGEEENKKAMELWSDARERGDASTMGMILEQIRENAHQPKWFESQVYHVKLQQ